jgi:hypothetical protein
VVERDLLHDTYQVGAQPCRSEIVDEEQNEAYPASVVVDEFAADPALA